MSRWVRLGGTALLAAAVLCFAALSWRWPVVNDAALMHYVVLLQQHGMAPYRDIHDINLPGAYLPDWLAMKIGGSGSGGDLAWRIYDFGLLGAATAAMVAIAYPEDWFAGVFAGGLLALFHGRDGIGQAGQRDLTISVLLLMGSASLLHGWRRAQVTGSPGRGIDEATLLLFGGFGVAMGAATTIKPFAALLFLLFALWTLVVLRRDRRKAVTSLAAALAGFALPLVAATLFLLRQHAWHGFLTTCRVAVPYHAAGAHPPFTGMLAAAFPASFLKLGAVALAIMLLRGSWRRRQTQLLLAGAAFGLFCFFLQHKGYGYQRYPYMGFWLLWVGTECVAALTAPRVLLRALGIGGLVFGIGVCAPSYLLAASRAPWPEPYLHAMAQDLSAAGGSALSGRVQCVDSISGCVTVLYRMRLVQATGTLYDEFLFPPAGAAMPAAVEQGQQDFLHELVANPPQVFIMSSWLFPEGPGNYGKLALWPAFNTYLQTHYRLSDQQTFPYSENGPLGFRMYIREP